jgi:hypothetical protein
MVLPALGAVIRLAIFLRRRTEITIDVMKMRTESRARSCDGSANAPATMKRVPGRLSEATRQPPAAVIALVIQTHARH